MKRKSKEVGVLRKYKSRKSKNFRTINAEHKLVFCVRPTSRTPARELSLAQRELLRISKVANASTRESLGKYRSVTQFIRVNREELNRTENKLLVAAGFCKSAASEIVQIAVHSKQEIFLKWLKGDIGFRVALREAKIPKSKTKNC